MKWEISIQDSEVGSMGRFAMEGQQVRIGRLPDLNDLVIPHPEVSRQHAVLHTKNGRIHVTDMGSKNACYLQDDAGKWIKVIGEQTITCPTTIRLGSRLTLEVNGNGHADISAEVAIAHPERQKFGVATVVLPSPQPPPPPPSSAQPGNRHKNTTDTLAIGTVVNGQYRIESILGRGGFGITYLGRDDKLARLVAIKEYFCRDFAVRQEGGSIRPIDAEKEKLFEWGHRRFAEEGKILAQVRHPNLVKILNYFEANGTAYLVMEYEEGKSLESMLTTKKPLDETIIRSILEALMSSLEVIHDAKLVHRDIKPANIVLRQDGSPVLLDFGSARQLSQSGQSHKQFTSMFSPGYTPFEQYTTNANLQGPWTDIYALSAVIYHMIIGKSPVDAQVRMACQMGHDPDPLQPCSRLGAGRFSPGLLRAVDRGLALDTTDRPASIAAWRQLLIGPEDPPGKTTAPSSPSAASSQPPRWRDAMWPGIAALVVSGGFAWYWLRPIPPDDPMPAYEFASPLTIQPSASKVVTGTATKALPEPGQPGSVRKESASAVVPGMDQARQGKEMAPVAPPPAVKPPVPDAAAQSILPSAPKIIQAANGGIIIRPYQDLRWRAGPPPGMGEVEDKHGISLNGSPGFTLRKEPAYRDSKVYYGALPLVGKAGEGHFSFAVDGLDHPPWRLYFDRNNNGDLTDDGPPIIASQPRRLEADIDLSVGATPENSRDGQGGLRLGVVITTGPEGKLQAFFRAKSHLAGKIDLDGRQFEVAAFEPNLPTGLFRKDGLLIDLNRDGRFDQVSERFLDRAMIPLVPRSYRLVIVGP